MKLIPTCGLITTLLLATSSHAGDDKPRASIVKTPDKVTIDGKLTEKTWRIANTYRIDWVFGGKDNGKLDEKRRGTVQYAWDESYLYVAYRIFDENIVNRPSDEEQGPKNNRRSGLLKYHKTIGVDFTMMLISLNDPNFIWEIDHNASNQVNDASFLLPSDGLKVFDSTLAGKNRIVEQKGEYVKDQSEVDWDTGDEKRFSFKTAVSLMKGSTVAVDDSKTDTDTGYVAEMRIPWFGLGAPLSRKKGFTFDMNGQVIRLLTLIRNGDVPGIYHASYKLKSGFAHGQMENWQAFTLRK